MGDGDFQGKGVSMHLRLGFLVAPRARLGLGFGHRFGSGSVRPPAADDARRDLEFQRLSWLGCLRHGQRNLVMVGLRIRGGVWAGFVSGQGGVGPPSARAARPTRASAQASMSPGCLSPSSSSSVPVALASGSARAAALPAVVSCKRPDGPWSHAVVTRGSKSGR